MLSLYNVQPLARLNFCDISARPSAIAFIGHNVVTLADELPPPKLLDHLKHAETCLIPLLLHDDKGCICERGERPNQVFAWHVTVAWRVRCRSGDVRRAPPRQLASTITASSIWLSESNLRDRAANSIASGRPSS